MKKNLFLRLCLTLVVAFSISSCRTDHLQENETFNNSSKFQLTSKRISLNESKHKSVLLPELEKAETAFKNSKTNVNGRVFDYGNGVSIDTDDVIYIENGPNYYTYTFHIKRENAPADAPLENLLLVPLPDGKYNEFLITYNLTLAEKESLKAGLPINTNGKSQVTPLENGTFNGGSQLARQVCTSSSYSYWAPCSENKHDGSNYEQCTFFTNPTNGTPPINYTIVTTTCLEQNETIITPIDPGGNSGGGGGGSMPGGTTPPPNNPPCTGTTIPTNPQPGFTDENGCPIGAPSLPNYPVRNNPCEKTKALLENTEIQTNISALKEQSKIKEGQPGYGEKAFKLNADGSATSPIIQGDEHSAELGYVENYTSFYHNHTPDGIKIHSPPDIYMLFKFIAAQPTGTPVSASFGGMVGSNECASGCPDGYEYSNFIIRFGGTLDEAKAIKNRNYTEADLKIFTKNFGEFEQTIRPKSGYSSQNGNFLSFKGLEEVFFYALDKMNIDKNKIILQRIDKNGTVYNVTLDSNGKPVETPCP